MEVSFHFWNLGPLLGWNLWKILIWLRTGFIFIFFNNESWHTSGPVPFWIRTYKWIHRLEALCSPIPFLFLARPSHSHCTFSHVGGTGLAGRQCLVSLQWLPVILLVQDWLHRCPSVSGSQRKCVRLLGWPEGSQPRDSPPVPALARADSCYQILLLDHFEKKSEIKILCAVFWPQNWQFKFLNKTGLATENGPPPSSPLAKQKSS